MPDVDEDPLRRELRGALDDERSRAQARLDALTRDLEDIVERSADAVRDDEHDPEGATIAFERAQVSALLDDARGKLADVERATERLDRGDHDRCETCGTTIPADRLRARPTTRRCVACAR